VGRRTRLDLLELAPLALAVPLWFLPHAFDVLEAKRGLLIGLGGLFVSVNALRRGVVARVPLAPPLAVLALVVLVGTLGLGLDEIFQSEPGANAWLGLKQQLMLLVLVAAAACVQATAFGRERAITALLLAPAALVSAYAIGQALGYEPFEEFVAHPSPVSSFGNGNALGEYLAPAAALALVLFGAGRGALAWIAGALATILLTAVLETQSRGALLATGAGVLAAWWARARPGEARILLGRSAAAILLAAGAAAAISGAQVLKMKALPVEPSIVSKTYPTNAYRLALYEGSVVVAERAPILGQGPGSFRTAFAQARAEAPRGERGEWARELAALQPRTFASEPHQDFLWIAIERGWPAAGALAVAALLALLALRRESQFLDEVSAPGRLYRLAAGCAVVAFFANGLVRTCFLNPGSTVIAFLALGLLCSAQTDAFPIQERGWWRSALLLLVLGLPALLVGALTVMSQRAFARVGEMSARAETLDAATVKELLERAARLDPSDYDCRQVLLSEVLVPWAQRPGAPPELREQARRLAQRLLAINPASETLPEILRLLSAAPATPGATTGDSVAAAEALIEAGRTRDAKRMLDRLLPEGGGQPRRAARDVPRLQEGEGRRRGGGLHAPRAARLRLSVPHEGRARRRRACAAPLAHLRRRRRRVVDARGPEPAPPKEPRRGTHSARRGAGARPPPRAGLGARRGAALLRDESLRALLVK
jgi:O-antigen ligase